MKALVLVSSSKLEYRDVPEPMVGQQDVLIEVKASGICGSDVHGMDGSTGRRKPPIVMGHEAAGIIRAIGQSVTDWQPGERVTFDSTENCGKCSYCRAGQINLCDNRRVFGVSTNEYRRDGALAELVSVPEHIVYRLPEEIGFEQAAMTEPLSVAVHAVSQAWPRINESAAVVGAGMIGLLVIQVLRASGCGNIFALDIDANRLRLAGHFGANVLIDVASSTWQETLQAATFGRGVDLAIEAVGISAAVQTSIKTLKKGGRLVLVGNISNCVDFPLQAVVTREISVFGSCASRGEYPACLDLISRKIIDVKSLISATAPLSEGANWFSRLSHKEADLLKVILVP